MESYVTLVFSLLLAAPSFSQKQSTIENILSYSFPTELIASPDAEAFAWVENKEGVRNIWYAEGPDFEGRPLTNYVSDGGQAISGLIFTHDRQHILYVRGKRP